MNPENTRKIMKMLIGLSEVFGESMTETRLGIYAEVLKDFPAKAVEAAIREIVSDPKQTRFPLPAMIREKITPIDNPEADAIDAANRIVEAIARIGYASPKEAQSFVGELGWLIVQREGGWEKLCERVQINQIPTLKAQWRELGKALYLKAKQGKLNEAPALPEANSLPDNVRLLMGGIGR